MYDDNYRKLYELKEKIQHKNKVEMLLKKTEQDLIQEKLKLNFLLSQSNVDISSIDKMQTTGLFSLFYMILGSKGEQTDKERQDILKSTLKYDQCKRNVECLVDESKRLVDEISQMEDYQIKYDELLAITEDAKPSDAEQSKFEFSLDFKKMVKRKEHIKTNLREITEAIDAGDKALIYVEKTIKILDSIEGWGDWTIDINNMEKTFTKCHYVDQAKEYVESAQWLMDKFKRELTDVVMITGGDIPMNTFENFSDYFFDGLIFDWVVQSEIGRSIDTVKNIKNQIDRVMSKLYEEKVTEEFLLQQLEDKIKSEVEKDNCI